jgi:hypothetical protein
MRTLKSSLILLTFSKHLGHDDANSLNYPSQTGCSLSILKVVRGCNFGMSELEVKQNNREGQIHTRYHRVGVMAVKYNVVRQSESLFHTTLAVKTDRNIARVDCHCAEAPPLIPWWECRDQLAPFPFRIPVESL